MLRVPQLTIFERVEDFQGVVMLALPHTPAARSEWVATALSHACGYQKRSNRFTFTTNARFFRPGYPGASVSRSSV